MTPLTARYEGAIVSGAPAHCARGSRCCACSEVLGLDGGVLRAEQASEGEGGRVVPRPTLETGHLVRVRARARIRVRVGRGLELA